MNFSKETLFSLSLVCRIKEKTWPPVCIQYLAQDARHYLSERAEKLYPDELNRVYDSYLNAFSEIRLIQNLPLHRIHRSWIKDRLKKEPDYMSLALLDFLSRDLSFFHQFKTEVDKNRLSSKPGHPEVMSYLRNEFLQPFFEAQVMAVSTPFIQKILSQSLENMRGMIFQLGRMGIQSLGEKYPEVAEKIHIIGRLTGHEAVEDALDGQTISLLSLLLCKHIDRLMKHPEPLMALGVIILAIALAGEKRSAVLSVTFALPPELGTFLIKLYDESANLTADDHIRSVVSQLIAKENIEVKEEKR